MTALVQQLTLAADEERKVTFSQAPNGGMKVEVAEIVPGKNVRIIHETTIEKEKLVSYMIGPDGAVAAAVGYCRKQLDIIKRRL